MERSYFFNSDQNNIRSYLASDYARYHAQIVGNGVSNTANLSDLSVSTKEDMMVLIGAGYAFANGYMYENTAALDLVHDTAEPDVERIDRVVIRFDNTPGTRGINSYVKKGVPASSPIPPGLQRDSLVYELSVAQVLIESGKSFIEQYQITDERTNPNVCGYIPLHNIYRGLDVSPEGIPIYKNTCYLQTRNDTVYSANLQEYKKVPLGAIEEEMNVILVNNEIHVEFDGVYNVRLLISVADASLAEGNNFQVLLRTAGNPEDRLMDQKVVASGSDNMCVSNAFIKLKKGDIVSFFVYPRFLTGSSINFSRAHLTWTKIS
jgi:hypothetical protein